MSTFSDLVNIEEFDKRNNFSSERWEVSFYCKDCKKIVETEREKEDSYVFKCKKCEWKKIALWTLEWLKSNYKIK